MKGAQRLFSLRHSEIFESFNPVELGRLLGILEELELPKHHVLFSPGGPCDSIYFIESGRVRVTRLSTEGKTVILALLGPGAYRRSGFSPGAQPRGALAFDPGRHPRQSHTQRCTRRISSDSPGDCRHGRILQGHRHSDTQSLPRQSMDRN